MSHRIFRLDQVSQSNKAAHLKLWRKETAERSGDAILFGLVQFVLDVLQTECTDANINGDFTLPTNIVTATLNAFITGITTTKHFNADQQKEHEKLLSQFIEMCVQHSENTDWMQPMLIDCLCILCENNATASLVANTVVGFYFRVLIKRHDQRERTRFWHELGHIRERIYRFIVLLPDDSNVAIDGILSTFFKRLNANPEVVGYDDVGMGEILGKFFLVKTLNVNLKLLNKLLAFCKKHPEEHGDDLLALCTNQPAVTNGLSSIITDVSSVQAQRLALELAYEMQSVISDSLFNDTFYKGCLLSVDQTVRDNVANLYRVAFQKPGTDGPGTYEPDTQKILSHAMELYKDYRVDYTTCAKRLTHAFYDEFTDWKAIFALTEQNIGNAEFIGDLFNLLKFVYKYIKMANTPAALIESEELLRTHAKSAIQCLNRIDRPTVYVDAVDQLICAILYTDKELKLISNADCETLAAIIIAMSAEVNMLRIYAAHTNMMMIMKRLNEKGFIGDEILLARIKECLTERAEQLPQLKRAGTNFDENSTILYSAMKLNVLTELQLISDESTMRQICIDCDGILMKKSLEVLGENPTFYGYTILTLVQTHIFAYKKAGNRPRRPDASVSSPSKITDRLLDILKNRPETIDFLIQATIWGLCKLELYFLTVYEKKALNAITDCVLQKVNLVKIEEATATRPRQTDLVQLKYVEYMLHQIHILLKVKRSMNVRELIVALYTKFPDFQLALDLMQYTGEAQLFPQLNDAILDILKQLRKKPEQVKFIGKIKSILDSMPNNEISRIRAEVRKLQLNVNI